MSRKFAKEEIIIHKCNVCGARNKLFKKIDKRKFTITCCNCGHFVIFHNDPSMNIPGLNDLDKMLNSDNEVCIRLTMCRNKKCRYYKNGSNISDKPKSKCGKYCSSCCSKCKCFNTECTDCDIQIINRNSDDYQLDINGNCNSKPKFH